VRNAEEWRKSEGKEDEGSRVVGCNGAPKGEHSYLLSNQLGRVSMLAKTYRNDGPPMEASLKNLKIVGCTYSLAIERLYPTSQSENSKRECGSCYREARQRFWRKSRYMKT
jgi:hypothetical protein